MFSNGSSSKNRGSKIPRVGPNPSELSHVAPTPSVSALRPGVAAVPLRAAGGDDSVMSEPPSPASAKAEQQTLLWAQRVAQAHDTWTRLTADQLLQSGGTEHALTLLVAECYALSPEQAGLQVRQFLAGHTA